MGTLIPPNPAKIPLSSFRGAHLTITDALLIASQLRAHGYYFLPRKKVNDVGAVLTSKDSLAFQI